MKIHAKNSLCQFSLWQFSLWQLLVAFVGLALLTSPAQAQLARDSKEPIDITGDRFEALDGQNYITWTGNVQVVQGPVVLTAPKMVFHTDEAGDLSKVNATGGVRYTNSEEKISGDSMIYDAASDTITVIGNVVVLQGAQVLSGEKLIYQLSNGQINFSGNGTKRVRGIFFSAPADKKTAS